jgi:hypothetical protein
LREALDEEEYEILSMFFMDERAEMHHDPAKKVLFVAQSIETISDKTGLDAEKIKNVINKGKDKLFKKRQKRKMPFVDRTFYTSINGMMIVSFLKAFMVTGKNEYREIALKSLGKILKRHVSKDIVFHTEGVEGLLEDYVHLCDALVNAYEVTGDVNYIDIAESLMESCINKLWDKEEGGFFDTGHRLNDIGFKGIEDIPHPSANAVAIKVLLKLFHISEKRQYLEFAESSLKTFFSKASQQGLISAYYFTALDAYFNMLKLSIHTSEKRMIDTAMSIFRPYKTLVYGEDRGYIIPCKVEFCDKPIKDHGELIRYLK